LLYHKEEQVFHKVKTNLLYHKKELVFLGVKNRFAPSIASSRGFRLEALHVAPHVPLEGRQAPGHGWVGVR